MQPTKTIFLVKSNIKHDGTEYKKGSFFEAEYDAFQDLVNDGVLRVVAGASSVEEAEAIIAKENEETGEQVAKEKEVQPENTWGPKTDEPEEKKDQQNADANAGASTDAGNPEDKKVEEYNGPMAKYKITGVASFTDEKGEKQGELEVGSIQNLPKEIGDQFVTDGVAVEVTEEKAPSEVGSDANKPEDKITGDNL